ncbi:uncharacterized protein LOC126366964 [Pectinophora gossypiella]|nr:uncharacterized protein LOC126366964 [Pectinophora gossypiella]
MTLSEYSHLKHQIVISVGSSERHVQLKDALKELFRNEINSPRRYEQINNISQLLNVLELRDVLSEDNVEPLKKIVERLPNCNDLMRKILQYEASHVPREYENYYASENTQNTSNRVVNESYINTSPFGNMSPKKKQRIIETVVEEIGNGWTDLARNLKIRECDIDDIDANNKSIARKSAKLMELYLEKKADPDKWFFVLCNALEKTRRKDLTKSIQKILLMNL